MDPVTQGMLGAAAGQGVSNRHTIKTATALGILSGMAPDLDILIRSNNDPLLALEYHRQFTHSLFFIPFGALLVACISYVLFARKRLSFKQTFLFCTAGYATHALLDACTTYGTLLLWPFTDRRVAWNTVSVVDPLFTIPALGLVLAAYSIRNKAFTVCAALWMASYLSVGIVQNTRALEAANHLASSRGHTAKGLGVKPSFANLVVWKSVYEYQGRYYVDAIRVLGSTSFIPGSSTPKLDVQQQFPWLPAGSQQALDVERFRWFSNDHLGLDPDNADRIIDIRYSLLPNQMTGMWGVELDNKKSPEEHIVYNTNRPKGEAASRSVGLLWSMINGTHPDLQSLVSISDRR